MKYLGRNYNHNNVGYVIFQFKTSKYLITIGGYPYYTEILVKYKNDLFKKVDSNLFFKWIPDLNELISCSDWLSDNKINNYIDKLLKLSAFY